MPNTRTSQSRTRSRVASASTRTGRVSRASTGTKTKRSATRAAGLKSKLGKMDIEKAMVLLHTALAIAIVIKQSRNRKKSGKTQTAMSLLSHYLTEGRELTATQRATLDDVKAELQALYARRGQTESSTRG